MAFGQPCKRHSITRCLAAARGDTVLLRSEFDRQLMGHLLQTDRVQGVLMEGQLNHHVTQGMFSTKRRECRQLPVRHHRGIQISPSLAARLPASRRCEALSIPLIASQCIRCSADYASCDVFEMAARDLRPVLDLARKLWHAVMPAALVPDSLSSLHGEGVATPNPPPLPHGLSLLGEHDCLVRVHGRPDQNLRRYTLTMRPRRCYSKSSLTNKGTLPSKASLKAGMPTCL